MIVNATKFRSNLYKLLDDVIETGNALKIKKNNSILEVSLKQKPSKLDRLTRHNCLNVPPESIIHVDWIKEWKNDLP